MEISHHGSTFWFRLHGPGLRYLGARWQSIYLSERGRERLALPEYLFLSIDDFLLRRIVEFLTLVRGSVGLLLVVLGLVLLALDDHDDDGDDEDEGDHGPDDDGEEEVGAGQSLLLHYLQSSN